jgi:hypothetical protein
MISRLLPARRALDPSQRQLRQQQSNAPTPLRRQRLPNSLGKGAAHDAIQASARLREALCSRESATRWILSTYKRHLLWDIDDLHRTLKSRPALQGKSLSEDLPSELRETARRPTMEEFSARLATREPVDATMDVVEIMAKNGRLANAGGSRARVEVF